jgi:hypothetical protein
MHNKIILSKLETISKHKCIYINGPLWMMIINIIISIVIVYPLHGLIMQKLGNRKKFKE